MRNPDRIDVILEALGEAWKKSPDLRLTQLLVVCLHDKYNGPNPLFYVEDDITLAGIKSYISGCKGRGKE